MYQVGEDMLSVLYDLRDNKLSIADARAKVEGLAKAARARYAEGSSDWIQVEIDESMSKAYIRLIERHPDEPRFKFDAALEAIERKVKRVRI